MKSIKPKLLVALLLSVPLGSLFADNLRLNVSFWPGERTSALEEHYLFDNIIGNDWRINLPWTGKQTLTLPVGLEYKKSIGANNLVFLAEYSRYMPDYRFMGLNGIPSVSMVKLSGYTSQNLEASLGIEIKQDKFSITPRVGTLINVQSFNYDDQTIGNGTYTFTVDGPFKANAQGIFVGGNVRVEVSPELSAFMDVAITSPFLGNVIGSMDYSLIQAGAVAGGLNYYYSSGESDYEIDLSRLVIGADYKLNTNMSLFGGIRSETIKESYPGLFTTTYNVGQGFGFSVFEILTDMLFYSVPRNTEKTGFFFGVSLALDSKQ